MNREKSKTKRMISGAMVLVLIAIGVFLFTTRSTKAAGLNDITVTLSNPAVSATNVGVNLTFTPNTAVTNGSIIDVTYDTAFTGGAALTNADINVTGTNITSSTESNFLAGSFTSTLTTSGSVTTLITIAIDNAPGLTNPGTLGNYNWSVIVNIGGTGNTSDNGIGLAYVGGGNLVTITASVASNLEMEIFQAGTSTPLTIPNTCNIGTLTLGGVGSCGYDLGFGTNSTSGITAKIVGDAAMNSGGNTIDDCGGANCNGDGTVGVTANSEEYGFVVTSAGTGCTATASAPYGTADQAVPLTSTNIVTSTGTCDGTNPANISQRSAITHKASVAGGTFAGVYDQLVTFTLFSN